LLGWRTLSIPTTKVTTPTVHKTIVAAQSGRTAQKGAGPETVRPAKASVERKVMVVPFFSTPVEVSEPVTFPTWVNVSAKFEVPSQSPSLSIEILRGMPEGFSDCVRFDSKASLITSVEDVRRMTRERFVLPSPYKAVTALASEVMALGSMTGVARATLTKNVVCFPASEKPSKTSDLPTTFAPGDDGRIVDQIGGDARTPLRMRMPNRT